MESAKLKMVAALSVLSLYSSGFAIDLGNLPANEETKETPKVKVMNNESVVHSLERKL
jgi:hypothetical protein